MQELPNQKIEVIFFIGKEVVKELPVLSLKVYIPNLEGTQKYLLPSHLFAYGANAS